ncbi:type VI secretion system tube protein Hcp [Endozoicomonas sp. GU-1]|uniref:type VI secretion system tube protein Hcp n=1 Tax=Endozoicomonas sp. GU-1 TaxID=3009078 RepID=UPI0022B2FC1A|nr:type VI secretion system tube protein Hcp [Endozoicomonas sp. GU-1]WBA83390.1 type VI secretion system tube protein Hcp [Endozoicomonas sp. GU-1]WBA86322.1 type VI secretion system tube protein Hcp [Endozoicomonas sp. GU-1]
MATFYMNIDGQTPKGASTLEKFTGGDGLPKEGWFAISSFSWGASRSIGMDVGDHSNMESGNCMMHEFRLNKTLCGAYENILSLLLAPSSEGKKLFLIGTKPERVANQGPEVYLQVTLEESRLSYFSMSGDDGTPTVQYHITYSMFHIKHWFESASGELTPGGLITYNVKSASAESTVTS